MDFTFGTSVILASATEIESALGNDKKTWTYTVLPNAAFDRGGTNELTSGQDQVVTQPRVFVAPGGPVPDPSDQIIIGGTFVDATTDPGGTRYEVDGQPWAPENPFDGWQPGVTVNLKLVTG